MKNNCYPGTFIVIEGLDGSGQSTQAGLLKDFLVHAKSARSAKASRNADAPMRIKKGYQVVLTKEPTLDSRAGKKIRQVLDKKEKISPKKLQELFAEDRKEHLENVITPALKEGKIVISDRYFFSSFAYGTADGLDLEWLIKLNDEFLLPDLIFILKVSPKECMRRIKKRNKNRTLFEEKEKLEKVWQVYQILSKRFKNVRVIDGEKSIKEVFSQIKKIVLLSIFKKEV
jgi:dTMP kinase